MLAWRLKPSPWGRPGITWTAALLLSLSAVPSVHAQTATDAARQGERIQRQQQERIEQERRRRLEQQPRTDLQPPTPPTPSETAPGQPCQDIKTIHLSGAPLLSEADRKALLTPYLNRCLAVADIERLMSDITGEYIRRGYIATRTYVRAQDLSKGVLTILVVQGEVEKIELRDGGRHSVNLTTAFPGVIGDPLNLRDFEQGLDQINRLQSNHARLDMKPGGDAGSSVVVIHNQPSRRVHAGLNYDNYGSDATGKQQAGVNLSLDNPLHLNDNLYLSYLSTFGYEFDSRHSRSRSLFYSVPFGYFTVSAAWSRSDYATSVNLPSTTLIADGNQENASLTTEYIAYRDAINRVAIVGTLASQRSRNYLADQLLDVSSRRLSTFDLGVSWSTALAGGAVSSHLNHAWGLTIFNAMDDPTGLPNSAPRAQFRKWTAGAGWQRSFRVADRRVSFQSRLEGQYAQDVLYGSEQFSIGGPYSVRGFRDSTLAGDRGYYWRNDLALPVHVNWFDQSISLRPYIAFDSGATFSHYQQDGGHVTGASVGLDIYSRYVTVQLMGSRALSLPDDLDDEGFEFFARVRVSI